jgi:hypothetical protein
VPATAVPRLKVTIRTYRTATTASVAPASENRDRLIIEKQVVEVRFLGRGFGRRKRYTTVP